MKCIGLISAAALCVLAAAALAAPAAVWTEQHGIQPARAWWGFGAGIESVQEGRFVDGSWVTGLTLNGDETNQGRELFLRAGTYTLYRVRLYRYR